MPAFVALSPRMPRVVGDGDELDVWMEVFEEHATVCAPTSQHRQGGHCKVSLGQAGKGQSARGREMAAYLRCNLLLAAASPPGLEAHVGGAELNHATRLCWGSKVCRLTVALPHSTLYDVRAKGYKLLPPPELPEARQPGHRTRPRVRAPSTPT